MQFSQFTEIKKLNCKKFLKSYFFSILLLQAPKASITTDRKWWAGENLETKTFLLTLSWLDKLK